MALYNSIVTPEVLYEIIYHIIYTLNKKDVPYLIITYALQKPRMEYIIIIVCVCTRISAYHRPTNMNELNYANTFNVKFSVCLNISVFSGVILYGGRIVL